MDLGCHGLVPWRFTLAALQLLALTKSNQRETPRDKAVASAKSFSPYFVGERDSPRRKAVASSPGFARYRSGSVLRLE